MAQRCVLGVLIALLALLGAAAPTGANPTSKAPLPSVQPEQTPGYTPMVIEGFTVIVSQETLRHKNDAAFERKPLEILEGDLKTITRTLPRPALNVLRSVLIWVEWNETKTVTNGRGGNAVAFYCGGHQIQLWKAGRHPLQAKSIILNDMKAFTEMRQADKSLRNCTLLHEMAHVVHDQMLGSENPNVKSVYKQALDRKLLDPSAYAATNVHEFFAEMTCAYFDQLPYHPRTRADLKKHDPVAFKLMEATWGKSKVAKGEAAEPVARMEAPPLDELPLGRPGVGPEVTAQTLKGRPCLVIYWNGLESSSLLCLTKVAAWDAELRDFGLVVVAVHLDGKTTVDAKAKARARNVAFAVNLDRWSAGSLVKDFKDFPLALVYGHDGDCIFRGNPFDAEAAVREAVGAALVAELTPDALPRPLVPVVDALLKGKAPKTQFTKLMALTKFKTDGETAQLADKLLSKVTETATRALDSAESTMRADPLEAFFIVEPLAAAFKGTPIAARASAILARVKQTKEVGLELKARTVLATVKKLDAYLDSVPGNFDPARPRYRQDNAQALRQLEAAVAQMKRTWPTTRATQQALRVAEKFGVSY